MNFLRAACVGFFLVTTVAGTLGAISLSILPRPANHTVHAKIPAMTSVKTIGPIDAAPLEIVPYARIDTRSIPEGSALAKSRRYANTIWTLSDSGGGPVVFAVRETGEIIQPAGLRGRYAGIRITGSRNLDWESLALDDEGRLIIGDTGNNLSNRRNLCFYLVPEPNPKTDIITPRRKQVTFYFPTQDEFPAASRNYDCEACFALNGQIYFFTKHWTDTETILWRVDPGIESYQAAVPVARFDARGMVTDAALSPSHRRLAVLTYHGIWVFELPAPDAKGKTDEAKFLTHAPAHFRRISVPATQWQVEGITFDDDDTLLISAEQGALFRVPVRELDVGLSVPERETKP